MSASASDRVMRLYHRLPPWLQTVVASTRGYQLRWWRYGRGTRRAAQLLLERERWEPARLEQTQQEALARALTIAATRVPFYREQWAERRRSGDDSSWTELANWPILKKESVRQNPEAFLVDGMNPKRLFQEGTSGTTGTPIPIWSSRELLHARYAAIEARSRNWYGVSMDDRWGILGGKRIVPYEQTHPPFWVWNAGLRQLYLSSLHLKPEYMDHYLKAIRDHAIVYLWGYSSSLYWLALHALDRGEPMNLKVVITNAEPLFDYQREAISKAFQCPVRETYGQAEFVCMMGECEHDQLHPWPEIGYLELLGEDDQPVPDGELGRIVGTALMDRPMPLIRYEVGDMAQRPADPQPCSCGRGLPVIERVAGRNDDAIVTLDGRNLVQLDVIFDEDLPIHEAQIIQETRDTIRIKVVPAGPWREEIRDRLCNAMRERVGEMKIIVEPVDEIERTWLGKFRAIISNVDWNAPQNCEEVT